MLETLLRENDVLERCGLILTDGTIVEVTNIADEPEKRYDMSPEEVLPHLKAKTIAATWHTHPGADPNLSGDDDEGFRLWPDLEHCIIGIRDGKVTVVRYRFEEGLLIQCD